MTAIAESPIKRRQKPPRPPKVDPVTRYARDVVNGAILAGRPVRLACARHLTDLSRQDTRDFPYVFDEKEAKRAIAFFPDFLQLKEGVFTLLPWQQFIIGSLFGWKNADGYRRFRTSFLETSKGTGKTPMAAGVGLLGLIGDDEAGAEIYSLGVTADQANYLFQYAHRMATDDEELSNLLNVGSHNIAWLDTNSFFRPLSSEGRSLDNKNPHFALVDELQEHRTAVVVDKMRLGFKGRKQPLLFIICNSGYDRTSVCWNYHDLALKILDGTITDEKFFAYVCQLDACEQCREKGLTQADETCPRCDNWTDERVWIKTCPSLGTIVQVDTLRDIVREAQNVAAKQGNVKRLYFCLWTQAHTIWIPADRWEACRTPADGMSTAKGLPCAIGLDLSLKEDLTACVVLRRIDRPREQPPERVEVDDTDNGVAIKKVWSIDYDIEIIPYFWLPEETLVQRSREDRIPYDLWAAQGWLRVTPGAIVDYHLIYDTIVGEIKPKFGPKVIGFDEHNANLLASDLRDRAKFPKVIPVPQGRPLSEFVKLFDALVRMRRIRHDGNPVMSMCVANAEPRTDRYENMWLEKPSPKRRIDGAIGAIIGLHQLLTLPKSGPRRLPKVWTPAGFKAADGSDEQKPHEPDEQS